MAYNYIEKDIYKQLEQVINKLDESLSINKELNETIKNLNKTISELREENEKLLNEIDRLKNQNNKNSNNSSKPSSTDIVTPKKKTGTNLYNYRIKTGNKLGGQYNHQGNNLNKKDVEKLIEENKIEVKEIIHTIKGDSKKEPLIKYRYELEIKPYVEKPKEFYTDVTHDGTEDRIAIFVPEGNTWDEVLSGVAIMYGLKEFPKDKIEEYEKEYDDILELTKEENKQSKTQCIQIVMQY